jgi:uncharacterized zinc-type alcohol dehydrogenase-like protein
MDRKTPTFGGYSTHVVVTEAFALKVPASLDPAATAPLLCAGITTYSPLKEWKCKKGDHVGVVGLGGLGHMAVKIAKAMGAEVTVFSTSPNKEADAKRLGAQGFALSSAPDTPHDYNGYLGMLRPMGTMILVGAPPEPTQVAAFALIGGNKRLVGSMIGGIQETQEMLEFCAEHKVVSDIELIKADQINVAYDRVVKSDVRYRFVIDAASFRG